MTSNYTYQGVLAATNTAVATGTATNIGLVVMQSTTATSATVVNANGTSGTLNQTTIVSNSATVPVIVGIQPVNTAGVLALPTVGTYTGTYLVAFTYS